MHRIARRWVTVVAVHPSPPRGESETVHGDFVARLHREQDGTVMVTVTVSVTVTVAFIASRMVRKPGASEVQLWLTVTVSVTVTVTVTITVTVTVGCRLHRLG